MGDVTLTETERKSIGFHLACRLEDWDKEIKKHRLPNESAARKMWQELEQLIYTKLIPDSWCGPKPAYWRTKHEG